MTVEQQLDSFRVAASEAFEEAKYYELYGVHFGPDPELWTPKHQRVLAKFMTANKDDVALAKVQLRKTLQWRKDFEPLKAAVEEHDPEFEKLGIITRAPGGRIVTWNLYGAVQNPQELFSRIDKFVRWRVGLMERGIALLDLGSPELDQMDQVHDYMGISFLSMGRARSVRQGSGEVINLFQSYYPEFLRDKYFVNVPLLMNWMFKFARSMMPAESAEKFHVVGNGADLRYELGDWLPRAYGGKSSDLKSLDISASAKLGGTDSSPGKVEDAADLTASQIDHKSLESVKEPEAPMEPIENLVPKVSCEPALAETEKPKSPSDLVETEKEVSSDGGEKGH